MTAAHPRARRSWAGAVLLPLLGLVALEAWAAPTWQPRDLYIARHGQTEWNRVGRMQGDPDLGVKGYEDRISLYLALKDAGVRAIYTSALLRTKRTAAFFAGQVGVEPKAVADLNELRSGIFEGICYSVLSDEELEPRHAECRPATDPPTDPRVGEYLRQAWSKRMVDKADFRPPGGESYRDGVQRLRRFLRQNRRVLQRKTSLVVGHSGSNRILLAQIMDWPLELVVRLPYHNDWIYRVQAGEAGAPRLSLYRDGTWRPCSGLPDARTGLDCTR